MFEDPNAGGGATSDPPVGTGDSGKSIPYEEDVEAFEESDPPVGTGDTPPASDPPVGTGDDG